MEMHDQFPIRLHLSNVKSEHKISNIVKYSFSFSPRECIQQSGGVGVIGITAELEQRDGRAMLLTVLLQCYYSVTVLLTMLLECYSLTNSAVLVTV